MSTGAASPANASRAEEWMSAMDRRSFFKIVATTGAAAAAGGCGPSAEKLIPYVVPPDNIVPGIPAYFATVCRECPSGCGVLAKNRDGRVVKLEGNPEHPTNTGTLCVRAHAGLQGLYHPDRFRGPLSGGKPISWDGAGKEVGGRGRRGKADLLGRGREAARRQARRARAGPTGRAHRGGERARHGQPGPLDGRGGWAAR